MDYSDANKSSSSTTVDINTEDWCYNEEIELYSDQNDLFLRDEYAQTSNKDVMPFRISIPSDMSTPDNSDRQVTRTRATSNQVKRLLVDETDLCTDKEPLTNDSSRSSSANSSSVFYQAANLHQFSSNFVPTSPASIFASFVIVFVILSVTILPILTPQNSSSTTTEIYDYQFEETSKSTLSNKTASNNTSNEHLDVRCKCICPPAIFATSTPGSTHSNSNLTDKSNTKLPERRLYVGNVPPNQCNCNNVVLPHIAGLKILSKDFCIQCQCKYQSRNTTNIKRNVVFFVAVLSGLTIYMIVQYVFRYFRITKRSLPRRLKWLSFQISEGD